MTFNPVFALRAYLEDRQVRHLSRVEQLRRVCAEVVKADPGREADGWQRPHSAVLTRPPLEAVARMAQSPVRR